MRFIIILLGLLFTTVLSAKAQGISMSPTRLFFTGDPGQIVTEKVTLHNNSKNDYSLNINYKDWERDLSGNKIYYDKKTLPSSNAAWISTMEETILIPAGATKEVLVSMQIPDNASTTDVTNAMLFFTQLPQKEDKATVQHGIGIVSLFEFGLHIYYTPKHNERKNLEITDITALQTEDSSMHKVAIHIHNDGNTINDATVALELTNTVSGEEIKLLPKSISMMPQTYRIVEFLLPAGISGNYLGVTIVKMAGTNDLRVGEKTFDF